MSIKQNSPILEKLKEVFGIPTDKIWIYPVFFGFLIRLYQLTYSSIWHDEGYTMWLLRYNPLEIVSRTARDVHPPGYYLIAKAWVTVFGTSAFSIRFLSLIFSVGIIYLIYKIVEKVFSKEAAFWGSVLVAFSPFMVRFAQEARMYGVVAFFTTLGTYFLIRFIKEKDSRLLIPYSLSITAAIYTQYYAFFVIIVHWLIIAILTPGFFTFHWKEGFKKRINLFNPYWWVAGIMPIILYLPWFPVAYKQVTRVSGSYWIKPEWINLRTIPNNVLQFIFYNHLDTIYNGGFLMKGLFWLIVILLIGSPLLLLLKKGLRGKLLLFLLFGYLPMLLVFILSKVKTPVYQDRYFPFSAVAILALWGVGISLIRKQSFRILLGTVVLVVLIFGNLQMHTDTAHNMKTLSEKVKNEMKPGDIVLSGELYTFLDGSYYFGDKKIRLISGPVDGFGETSLFYDQQPQYLVSQNEATSLSIDHRVFIVGKTGDKSYFTNCFLGSRKSTVIYQENKDNGLKVVLYE